MPFEDEDGYERRWGGLSPQAADELSASDPLTFVADHLPHRDRTDGSIVVLLVPAGDGSPLVSVVSDCPPDPTPEQCYRLLHPFARAAGHMCASDGSARIGLLVHRRGPAASLRLDLRWLRAVQQAAQEAGIGVLGVLVRTSSGALLRVTDADAA